MRISPFLARLGTDSCQFRLGAFSDDRQEVIQVGFAHEGIRIAGFAPLHFRQFLLRPVVIRMIGDNRVRARIGNDLPETLGGGAVSFEPESVRVVGSNVGAAVGNAVANALRLQNGINTLPLAPERVLAAIGTGS